MGDFADLQHASDYIGLFEQLEKRRSVFEHEWEVISPYVNPRRSIFNNDMPVDEEGEPVAQDIFDSIGIVSATTMRDGLVGYNVGPRIRWAALTLTEPKYMDLPYVMDWLEDAEKILYMIWSNSNYYSASSESIMDAVSIGTATTISEEPTEFMKINYETRHPKETFVSESKNKVNLWARKIWLTGRSMISRYGAAKLGGEDAPLYKRCLENPTGKSFQVLHFIHPREEPYIQSPYKTNRPWISIEIARDDKLILDEDGYYESPITTWRWEKNAEESYGRSPALKAKSELIRVNEVGRTLMEKVQLDVEPPLNVPWELRGKERISPWGKNYYKRDDRKVEPWQMGGSYPIGVDWLDRLEKRIEDHFHADLFKMLTQAERQMTAREINERMGEKVALLSSPLTGQNSEALAPLVKRTFHIAMRLGWIPLPPPALIKARVDIDVEFIGPLAQAQQRYHQSRNITAGLQTMAGYVQASGHAEAWDNLDGDEFSRHVMESEGYPQKIIREITVRDQIRAERARQQQQQQQMERAEQIAGILPDLSHAPEQGSLAETLSNSPALIGAGA